jgi:glycine/D-amino acid oxidase-like deaminating enzyme
MQDNQPDSLWARLSPAGAGHPALEGDIEADVAIVGGGFLGLSSALHLAESGVRVALLEAAICGYGASGRNTGFVVPDLKATIGPHEVARHIGEVHAQRLLSLVSGSGQAVFDLIRRLDIACSPEQVGWTQPAATPEMGDVLEARARTWRQAGSDVRYMDRQEVEAATGIPGYFGAMHVASGGQINPFAYARGLARACLERGVALYETSPALSIASQGDTHLIRTPRGSVRAKKVLLATNAMTRGLNRPMADSVIATRIFQIATQVLPAEARTKILPSRAPISDTRHHTFALRWSPDGRLVTGGLVFPGPGRIERAKGFFTRRLEKLAPSGHAYRAELAWSGVIAVTLEWLPRMSRLGEGIYGAIGCNGRGIAMTTALGEQIAAFLSGAIGEDAFVVPIGAPKPAPGRRMAELGPHLFLPLSTWRDWRDARRNRS